MLVAWPPAKVLKKLKPGQTVPVVKVKRGTKAQEIRRYRHLEKTAGIVNLQLEPDRAGSNTPDSPGDFCYPRPPVFVKRVASKAATVAQSYSTITGVTQHFTYGEGQSSSIEFGTSATGESGTFGGSGTVSVSTEGGWKFTPQAGRTFTWWRTYFEWGLFYVGNSCSFLDYYESEPFQWNGGSDYKHPASAPKATFCVPAHGVDVFHTNDSTASTVGGGFYVLGLKGTVQTGYSQTAEISFDFHLRPAVARRMCGTKNDPGTSPGVLVARK
jgi:hypothetical protein